MHPVNGPSDLHTEEALLTSHVLDISAGKPAAGVNLSLFRIEDSETIELTRTRTNKDGRCDAPLLRMGAQAGDYRLTFESGAYFGLGEAALFDTVPIDFRIADASRHYHVPLTASPFGYSTYRGAPPAREPQDNYPVYRQRETGETTGNVREPVPPPGVGGFGITTHVIDSARGEGAAGMNVTVHFQDRPRQKVDKITGHDGRTTEWLVAPGEMEAGKYELVFSLGRYLKHLSAQPFEPFFENITARLRVRDTSTHYHIPLIVSPWGYSVYRGS